MGEAFDGGAGLWLMDWVVNRREFLSIGLFHLEQAALSAGLKGRQ